MPSLRCTMLPLSSQGGLSRISMREENARCSCGVYASQGLQHQLHVSRKPGAAACREPHIAYASPIDSDKAVKHIESKCCAVIGGCSFALLWLSAFQMGAATVAYSGKSPPLAILAAAQKAGLDVQVNEVKDGNKDAPPTLTMADGYVIWPMTSLTRRHQPPQRFGLGAE